MQWNVNIFVIRSIAQLLMTIFYYYTPNWWFNVVFASFIPLAISTVCLKSYLVETPQFLIGVDKDFGGAVASLQTIA